METTVRFSDYPLGLRLVTLAAVAGVLYLIGWVGFRITDALPMWGDALFAVIVYAVIVGYWLWERRSLRLSKMRQGGIPGLLHKDDRKRIGRRR